MPDALSMTPPVTPAALSRSTVMTVRRALHAYREGWLVEDRLAAAARMAADDAHWQGLTAVQLLVTLKRTWAGLDAVRDLPVRDAQALGDRLVTETIRAYYVASRHAGPREAPARRVA